MNIATALKMAKRIAVALKIIKKIAFSLHFFITWKVLTTLRKYKKNRIGYQNASRAEEESIRPEESFKFDHVWGS